MLGRREHSVAELRKKLQQKHRDLDPQALNGMLEGLQQDGLLSDERFAEILIRSRINRGYGPIYIRQELTTKGIDSELVAVVLEQTVEEQGIDWLQLAQELVQRRHPQANQDPAAWQKGARFLARRGFSSNLVIKALPEQPYH